MDCYVYFKTPKFFGSIDNVYIRLCFYDDIMYCMRTFESKPSSAWAFHPLNDCYSRVPHERHPDFSIDEINLILSEQITIGTNEHVMTQTSSRGYYNPTCSW